MALRIETFSSLKGGNTFYKAITHPEIAASAHALVRRMEQARSVAIVDPLGFADAFAAIFDLGRVTLAGVYVQSVAEIGTKRLGQTARPLIDLCASDADLVLIAAFDAGRMLDQMAGFMPPQAATTSLDKLRLPDAKIGNRFNYLDQLNFATNWAFFRDTGNRPGNGHHTRASTVNYWSGYGARAPALALILMDAQGQTLAQWTETLGGSGSQIVLDSREIRARFGLGAFEGQLFMHLIGAAGHDSVKYALDTWQSDGPSLSCTHDANMWPADFYAGLPAPRRDERVILWVQNCFPVPVPEGEITLNRMGNARSYTVPGALAPFASAAIDVGQLMPGLHWPEQIEIDAGRHMVRPRYEIERQGRTRIAHPNVERTDLKQEPAIAELGPYLGRGFLLPAPILPRSEWRSSALPTPMARGQDVLPIAARLYDLSGCEIARHAFGRLSRGQSVALEVDQLLEARGDVLADGGHIELAYDFEAGSEADGWLHALFRYEHRDSGHAAETSFGAHVFNTIMTWRDEPQSYAGRPPGLSTRLFLRLGHDGLDTLCHLIYPASAKWHDFSSTSLILNDAAGKEIAVRDVRIACNGSLFWRYSGMFDSDERGRAGEGASVTIRDKTCRLFGYHGLAGDDGRFSLDHMFGF